MRLYIELILKEDNYIKLPLHYNHLIQSLIYHTLDQEFAEFLHNKGYETGGRIFKLFTFSRLLGQYRIIEKEISFISPIKLIISSPLKEFCQYLLNGFLKCEYVSLAHNQLNIEKISLDCPKVKCNLKLKLLSPVVAYSTFLKPDGGKYTCYFQPGEKEFVRLIEENLKKKYEALYGQTPPSGEIQIRCLRPPRLHMIKYKNFVIKGYSGPLLMHGPAPLLQLALDAGLGGKNSMGFGCGEIID